MKQKNSRLIKESTKEGKTRVKVRLAEKTAKRVLCAALSRSLASGAAVVGPSARLSTSELNYVYCRGFKVRVVYRVGWLSLHGSSSTRTRGELIVYNL